MSEQVMVFVDAGYVWGVMRDLHGVSSLDQLVVDYTKLAELLRERIEQTAGPVLRIRWYDATDPARRITNPRAIGMAAVPGVRLVEGRLVHRNGVLMQKAVDTRLVADMVTIAHQRQVNRFVLLTGDEDMAPGVEAAEDLGLHVQVWSIEAPDSAPTVSRELVSLADEHRTISVEDLRPFITPTQRISQTMAAAAARTHASELPDDGPAPSADVAAAETQHVATPTSDAARQATPAVQPDQTPVAPAPPSAPAPAPHPAASITPAAIKPRVTPKPDAHARPTDIDAPLPNLWGIDQAGYHRPLDTQGQHLTDQQRAALAGNTYARRWWDAVDEETRERVMEASPSDGGFEMVPPEIDKDLLRFAEDQGLNTWGPLWVKALVRNGWWDALAALDSQQDSSS